MERIINPVLGEEVIYHTTAKQSNGEQSLMELTIRPKGGNPLHYHKHFSETFTIVDGELNVQVGEKLHLLKKGDTLTVPINERHRFFNSTDKVVRFKCQLTPASEGFENFLRIGFGLSRDGKAASNGMPKSILHIAILMNMGDINSKGIFSVFEKIFKTLAQTKKGKRIEKELLIKYCETHQS